MFSLLVPPLLVAAFYGGSGWVRRHVDGLIQGSVGDPLPAFALADAAGATWTPERLRGKPAVLHFFRSRCHSCETEAADYRQFETALADGRAVVLHVCVDRVLDFPPELTAATIAQKQFVQPVLMADAAFVDAFHSAKWSNVTPVTYVIDSSSRIRLALRGGQTLAQLTAALASVQ
jgi:peroxiredoxin